MRKRIFAAAAWLILFLSIISGSAAQSLLVIEPQELAHMLSEQPDNQYIDLRSEKEYNQMHIQGFSLLEYSDEAVLSLAKQKQPVVLICSTGVRSAKAYNLLVTEGRDDVYACIFGVSDFAEAMGEGQMEGDQICLPCLLETEEEAE